MKPIRNIIAAALLAALLGAGGATAAPDPAQSEPAGENARTQYRSAHDALERGRYDEAYEQFAALEKELRRTKSKGVDSALYWQAYSLSQSKRGADAERAVRQLAKEFPASEWKDDARALLPGRAEPRTGRADDADALMAIDALLTSGNRKAVPILQRVLAGDYSDKAKERALFVLTQIDPAAADQVFAEILEGNSSERMKREAIQAIAVGGNKASHERLLKIYRSSSDEKLRRSVIDAWLVSDRGDLVREAARTEADPKVRRHAINTLGAMGDVESIRALLPELEDEDSQRAAMHAFGVAGAAEPLVEVAKGNWPLEMRVEAVQSLGMVNKGKAGAAVVEFYRAEHPLKLRKAAVRALMMHGDGKRLIEIYRVESDPEMKRELLQAIAVSDSDEALDLIDEVLK
ncbi:MAG TPA: HEAT repeat domain-containing protein [Candidatus Saccharimonadia bacterium]|nr:HEAT repeat domain-containing protein [Candidatus Saccharimonadia bacterium]